MDDAGVATDFCAGGEEMPFECYAASGDDALENEADGGMETHAFDCSSGEVRQSGTLVVGRDG